MRSMSTEATVDRPRGEYGAHSLSTWSTFKIAFKKCFNIGVFYVPFCMENMDVFTFEPALPCSLFCCFLGVFMASRRYKDNAALRCALQTQHKKLQTR